MAINFPSTQGQAIDGTFTYVAAGITYSWNGESWTAAGSGATATDRTVFSAVTNSPGTTALTYNSNTGIFAYTPPDLSSYLTSTGPLNTHTDVNHGTPSDGDFLSWNQANLKWELFTPGTGSGLDADLLDGEHGDYYRNATNINSGTLGTARLSGTYPISISGSAATLGSLIDVGDVDYSAQFQSAPGDASGTVLSWTGTGWEDKDAPSRRLQKSVTLVNPSLGERIATSFAGMPRTYALLKVETSHPAWVTLYTDAASRTDDASRNQFTDPVAGSGVLTEVITQTGSLSQLISPGVICFSANQSDQQYIYVENLSGSNSINLQISLTYVPLEV